MSSLNLTSTHAGALEAAAEVEGRSLWQDAWRRLRSNRAAFVSMIILAIIALACVALPYALPWAYDAIDWDHVEAMPPNFELGHYLGTDSVGRDLLARTLVGGRISLMVGVLATLVALLIGVTVGAVAGYLGRAGRSTAHALCRPALFGAAHLLRDHSHGHVRAQFHPHVPRHRRGRMAHHGAHRARSDVVAEETRSSSKPRALRVARPSASSPGTSCPTCSGS